MPSKSESQKRFMQMTSHDEGQKWCKKKDVACPPKAVAKKFAKADKLKAKKK